MPVVVKNTLSTTLDIPGEGLMFTVDEQKTLGHITSALSAAIQAGHLEVVSQEATAVVTVEEDGQTVFELPFLWSGPDDVSLTAGGLIQVFGTDWSVDTANNQFEWLDEDVELEIGDVLVFVGRWSS